MLVFSFAFFMVAFAIIGCMSVIKSQKNTEDYLVAGRSLPPWLAGLSAVATNNSGFMFIGMIGYTYNSGLITIWFMLGWILGDYIGLKTVLQPVVKASHDDDSRSLGSLMSRWIGSKQFKYFGLFTAVITVLFLTVYAAAQFKAGSKSLEAIFGLDKSITIAISAGLVLLYCFSGGIRASIWTDAAQSIVMIIGMALLVVIGLMNSGNTAIADLPENYFRIIPGFKEFSMTVLGAIGGGLMITGQPQVVSRFFTLRSADEAKNLRFYYYLWFISFYVATIAVGIFCRILLDTNQAFDKEMALPRLAMQFLPDAGVGLILAAIFAATISTADSLILACTAAIDEEFNKKDNKSLGLTKTITLIILISSAGIAMLNNDTIFSLVLDAWAMLGVAFSPLIISRCLGRQFTEKRAIALSVTGLFIFIFISRGHLLLYEGKITSLFQSLNAYYMAPLISMLITFTIGLRLSSKQQ